ncbi:MAG: WD40 repeat protein [Rhodothermales bacterium]|jgi:WD40 repeat protein
MDTTTGRVAFRLNPAFGLPRTKYHGRPGHVWGTSFTNDSRGLAAATSDGVVTVWELTRGRQIAEFRVQEPAGGGFIQHALRWQGAHDAVIFPTSEGIVRCDMKTKKVTPLSLPMRDGLYSNNPRKEDAPLKVVGLTQYVLTPDSSRLLASAVVQNLRSWKIEPAPLIVQDLTTGQEIGRIPRIIDDRLNAMTLLPDGKTVAIGTVTGRILIYRLSDLEILARTRTPMLHSPK